MEDLKAKIRCASFVYYVLCGMSIILVIALLFVISMIGLLFSLYTFMLFLLGLKGYQLSFYENKHLATAYMVMSIVSCVFNFVWGLLNLVEVSIYNDAENTVTVLCFFAASAFSAYTSVLGWKYRAFLNSQVFSALQHLDPAKV